MKRLLALLLLLGMALLLGGCDSQPEVVDPSITVLAYSPSAANAMIDEAEWRITWLQQQETISRQDAQALLDRLSMLLTPAAAKDVLLSAIDGSQWEDPAVSSFTVLHDYMSPTVYYTGVSVTAASDTARCQMASGAAQCNDHHSLLAIHKEYRGDNAELKGWYLEYIFEQTSHNGPWSFYAWNGTYNLPISLQVGDSFAAAVYEAP